MRKVLLFAIVLTIAFMVSVTASNATAIPNLDGDSHPNRLKLNECIADVKEVTAWDEKQTLEAARKICEARQSHTKQKARFLASLKNLHEQYQGYTNHGFDKHLPTAIEDSWTIVKSCIDFKEGFTSPHNIGLLEVPENIRISCYSLGTDLVQSQLFNQK